MPVAVGAAPHTVAVADFDGDGNEDLAVTNQFDHAVSIRLGAGDGTFTNAPTADLGGSYVPQSLVVGDFNNDTWDDLAVATTGPDGQGSIRIRLGQGNGTFVAGTAIASFAGALAVGDANADAIEDLLLGNTGAGKAGVLLGKGGGAFGAGDGIELFAPAGFPRSLALADFDADGRLDVLAASRRERVSVRYGTGDGKFGAADDPLLAADSEALAAAAGDFNSDAREDFVVTDAAAGGQVHVRLSDGARGFVAAPPVKAAALPIDIAVADFDGDGNEDIATANLTGNSVSVRRGTGSPPLAGNLLVNGGFEGPVPSGKVRPVPPIFGWELSEGTGYVRYGARSHFFVPSWPASARYGGGGRMLWGGYSAATLGINTAAQTVDVSDAAPAIDAGRVRASLSAYLGGTGAYGDAMRAQAEFRDAAGVTLGVLAIGPVTEVDRRNLTTLLHRAADGAVPPGTRRIRVTFISEDADKAYSSAMADNAKLTLATVPEPEPAGPGGGDPQLPAARQSFGDDPRVTLELARRRIRPRGRIGVRVANGNGFPIGGRVVVAARARRASRELEVGAGGAATVALPLSPRARRALVRTGRLGLRLAADVTDPSGGTRRLTLRARVRLRRA